MHRSLLQFLALTTWLTAPWLYNRDVGEEMDGAMQSSRRRVCRYLSESRSPTRCMLATLRYVTLRSLTIVIIIVGCD